MAIRMLIHAQAIDGRNVMQQVLIVQKDVVPIKPSIRLVQPRDAVSVVDDAIVSVNSGRKTCIKECNILTAKILNTIDQNGKAIVLFSINIFLAFSSVKWLVMINFPVRINSNVDAIRMEDVTTMAAKDVDDPPVPVT